MDDKLCDTVMMGAVQLQAAFSVVAPRFAIHPKGFDATRRGTLEQGCTRGTTDVWCVLPLLRVLRSTTIAVLPTLNTISTQRPQQPVRRAVTHTRRCWCNSDTKYTRGTYAVSLGVGEEQRWRIRVDRCGHSVSVGVRTHQRTCLMRWGRWGGACDMRSRRVVPPRCEGGKTLIAP
jgi:hypothetical protein